jgi:hypothetical protein
MRSVSSSDERPIYNPIAAGAAPFVIAVMLGALSWSAAGYALMTLISR